MNIFVYPEVLIEEASNIMVEMFDIAVNNLHYDLDEFMKLFIGCGNAKEFAHGSMRIISRIDGQDVLDDVLFKLYHKVSEVDYIPSFHLSPEYWAGWILAQYQHYSCQSFKTITDCIPISSIVKLYHPYHEAHEYKTFELIDEKLKSKGIPLFNTINANGDIVNIKSIPTPESKILYLDKLKKIQKIHTMIDNFIVYGSSIMKGQEALSFLPFHLSLF